MYKITESELNEITNLLDSFSRINTDRPNPKELINYKFKTIKLSGKIKANYTKIKSGYE